MSEIKPFYRSNSIFNLQQNSTPSKSVTPQSIKFAVPQKSLDAARLANNEFASSISTHFCLGKQGESIDGGEKLPLEQHQNLIDDGLEDLNPQPVRVPQCLDLPMGSEDGSNAIDTHILGA